MYRFYLIAYAIAVSGGSVDRGAENGSRPEELAALALGARDGAVDRNPQKRSLQDAASVAVEVSRLCAGILKDGGTVTTVGSRGFDEEEAPEVEVD